MAVLLFSVGTFALVAGLVMIGFGIPINEFSFGNTLISAGTTAAVGGLIIIALGVTVGQLRRIAEALAAPSPNRFAQPIDISEAADGGPPVAAAPGRIPFPPRPKAEAGPAGAGLLAGGPAHASSDEQFVAPTLRNPEEAPMVEDEISLSPGHSIGAPSTASEGFGDRARPSGQPAGISERSLAEKNQASAAGWRASAPPIPAAGSSPRPPQAARFDAMWPAEAKAAKTGSGDEAKLAGAPKRTEPEGQKPRAVAILKSGVVDGMGYTLYVDGSIEAELPQGTLRFASINELRSHLEKNS